MDFWADLDAVVLDFLAVLAVLVVDLLRLELLVLVVFAVFALVLLVALDLVLVDFVLAFLAKRPRAGVFSSSIFWASSRVMDFGSTSLGILTLLKRPGPLM